jgi:hypothetical protein
LTVILQLSIFAQPLGIASPFYASITVQNMLPRTFPLKLSWARGNQSSILAFVLYYAARVLYVSLISEKTIKGGFSWFREYISVVGFPLM